jgi:hypothetical protein
MMEDHSPHFLTEKIKEILPARLLHRIPKDWLLPLFGYAAIQAEPHVNTFGEWSRLLGRGASVCQFRADSALACRKPTTPCYTFHMAQPSVISRLSRPKSWIGWTISMVAFLWAVAGHLSTAQSVASWLSGFKDPIHSLWLAAKSVDVWWYQSFLFLAGVGWLTFVATRPQPQAIKSTWFFAEGCHWQILSNFESQFQFYPPDDATTYAILSHIFQGPYCRCLFPLGDDLLARKPKCSNCGEPLVPGTSVFAEGPTPRGVSSSSLDPLWPLRKAAYRKAIAAHHAGALRS